MEPQRNLHVPFLIGSVTIVGLLVIGTFVMLSDQAARQVVVMPKASLHHTTHASASTTKNLDGQLSSEAY